MRRFSLRAPGPKRFRNIAWGLLGVTLLPPFLRPFLPGATMLASLTFIGLVTRTLVVSQSSRLFRIVFAIAMTAVAMRAAGVDDLFRHAPWGVQLALRVGTSIGFGFVVYEVLRNVLAEGRVDSEKLYAAVSAYLLMGLAFASLYEALDFVKPDAFLLPANAADDSDALLYFSLVTLSTVGYGDLVPGAPEARMLAVSEAILGQLYLAILMARLVGLHLEHSRATPEASSYSQNPADDRRASGTEVP